MNNRVRKMLSWYSGDNPGTLANLARILNHGRLAGTGRLVVLPVDQGFEHGPAQFCHESAGLRSPLPLRVGRRGRLAARMRPRWASWRPGRGILPEKSR